MVSLNLEDRRNLCIAAREHTSFYFLDYNVPPAQPYEFIYAGIKETNVAISCPTSPQLYLRRGDTETELKIMLHPSIIIDEYELKVNMVKPTSIIRGKLA
mgnify:CR=1 FL=1